MSPTKSRHLTLLTMTVAEILSFIEYPEYYLQTAFLNQYLILLELKWSKIYRAIQPQHCGICTKSVWPSSTIFQRPRTFFPITFKLQRNQQVLVHKRFKVFCSTFMINVWHSTFSLTNVFLALMVVRSKRFQQSYDHYLYISLVTEPCGSWQYILIAPNFK